MAVKKRRPTESLANTDDDASSKKPSLAVTSRITAANALTLDVFRGQYMPSDTAPALFMKPGGGQLYKIMLASPSSINKLDSEACFNLIRETSAEAYKSSSIGWSSSKKKKEMQLPDLRYLLVKPTKPTPDSTMSVEAFLSFMLTYEDGHEVIYCYEIHLAKQLRGCGLGKKLMEIMEDVGRKVGLGKAMLTVFVKNEVGVNFYERLGYTEDEFSPPAKRLRNGLVRRPNYIIMSKSLREHVE
ncbi:MAG: hypothetical protein M1827_002045 [Pycnora praestabilis]|nr:MAG: hypothetical protein M1827_002045 [Pycnora praestabilis]